MSNETSQETWNATHSQLLKSVADAQAKLLAAQNETCDRLESASRNLGLVEQRLTERLKGLSDLSFLIGQTQETVRNSHGSLTDRLEKTEALAFSNHTLHCSIEKKVFAITGQLDAIGAILAELLTVRWPGPRPTKRNQRKRRA